MRTMSDFLVSARKYRPQLFLDMVGQEHVSNTLRNAIKSGKLAHAFLFCGPRGVGKTTAARILAKTINCETPTANFEACGTCKSCSSFAQNSSFNIYELDAASNNSVDDIRELVNQVRFPPQSGKFKIYIIDEVHMLSQAAFNAFLKTLEEPPAYCKFILATTEKHKILPTILSRCQVFDFRRIPVETIVNHLRDICTKESIPFDEDTLHVIAQKADGGMRDSLSMLDRLVSFGGGKLVYAEVLENLNVLDYDYYFKITEALLAENVSDLLLLFQQIIQKGFEGDDFIIGLCEHFRSLLFCKSEATAKVLELSSGLKERYVQQAAIASGNFLINCLALGNECDVRYKQSKNKRLTVELALVKMCFVNRLSEVGLVADKKKTNELNTAEENEAEELANLIQQHTAAPIVPTKPAATSTAIGSPPIEQHTPPASQPPLIRRTAKVLNAYNSEEKKVDAIQQNTEQQEIFNPKNIEILELNQENTLLIWKKFSEQLPEVKRGAKALFSTYLPTLILHESKVEVRVQAQTQYDKISEEIIALEKYFKLHTGVTLQVVVTVDKINNTSATKIYYTDEEKVKRLLEKNKYMKRFQQLLGLEPDLES